MIHVGVDLHQRFCYLTAVDARGQLLAQRSVANEAVALRNWLRSLPGEKQVVVEACGFWPAFRRAVESEVARLVMVHPARVKAIASARLKNDRVDSATLATCRVRICCRWRGCATKRRGSYGCRFGCE